MTLKDLQRLRASRPAVDITPEPNDSAIMATVAAVAADPATLTYDELVAAAVRADHIATWNLLNDVVVLA